MKHFTFLVFFILSLSNLSSARTSPNIIVFLVDDMGAMDTSVPFVADENGNPKRYKLNEMYKTPAMEKLAQSGCRFSNAYAMSVCSPSRTSILTGQNSARHATTNWINPKKNNSGKFGPKDWNWKGLDKASITIPILMKTAGYKTIHIGKAHFAPIGTEGENPKNLGFDVNIAGCAWGQPGSYYGTQNFTGKRGENPVPNLEKYFGKDIFLTDALTLEAQEQIKKCVDEKKPFFLYMSHYAVHSPFQADSRFIQNYAKYKNSTSKDWPAFASMIESMDKSLGDLLDFLKKMKIADDTLIIFLGDNGSDARIIPVSEVEGENTAKIANAAPFRGMKASKYEGGVRIPFIVSWANLNSNNENQKRIKIKSGAFLDEMATVYDILPTIMEVANIKYDKNITDGIDLSSRFSQPQVPQISRKFLMHYPHEHRCRYFTTLRNGDWKLIKNYENNTFELYNLKTDLSESKNLVAEYPQKVKVMSLEMEKILKEQNAKMPKF